MLNDHCVWLKYVILHDLSEYWLIWMTIIVLGRTWMIGIELGKQGYCQTSFSATAGRMNRFLCGKNRVPGVIYKEEKIQCLRKRLLLGRNRVPSVNFARKTDFYAGTGYSWGGTGFPVQNPESV